ncbi:hypothetical protein MLD38_029405 [Melastoma candidum]|uniref:Uncharacterized protein n=1 Tax=Melastoma candidum TaxID=119954 RepID=A0ACB9N3P5_9MYRT|nr:hypothetical protein MLD38_029405 [Melastoma candidum]
MPRLHYYDSPSSTASSRVAMLRSSWMKNKGMRAVPSAHAMMKMPSWNILTGLDCRIRRNCSSIKELKQTTKRTFRNKNSSE